MTESDVSIPLEIQDQVTAVFGDRLELAQVLATFLGTAGLERGLLGPRELPKIWDRHLLNCAVLSELLPIGAKVVDIGSGAGLPGLVLACRRPDLRLILVESLQRRVDFLSEAVALLGFEDSVQVVHGRAEDRSVVEQAGASEWVTARAVAPLDRLARWSMPLLSPGGSLLAMKGSSAEQEVIDHRSVIGRFGGSVRAIVECGEDVIASPLRVVVIERVNKQVRKGRAGR